jgi:hypothetical protein
MERWAGAIGVGAVHQRRRIARGPIASRSPAAHCGDGPGEPIRPMAGFRPKSRICLFERPSIDRLATTIALGPSASPNHTVDGSVRRALTHSISAHGCLPKPARFAAHSPRHRCKFRKVRNWVSDPLPQISSPNFSLAWRTWSRNYELRIDCACERAVPPPRT